MQAEEIERHYEIEKELAAQLKEADRGSRKELYTELYDELFRRVPSHPCLTRLADPAAEDRYIAARVRLLTRLLGRDEVFLEVGPGACRLALAMTHVASQVYAVDVSTELTKDLDAPDNFELVISDGSSIPVAAESVDLCFSDQLMEHLHPEDAAEQLGGILRALRPGGAYFCVTPNRLNGPHDVSRGFDPVATGFHLKEYTYRELVVLFRETGFGRFSTYLGPGSRCIRVPVGLRTGFEVLVEALPRSLGSWLANSLLGKVMLSIKLVAFKDRG